MEQGTVEGIVRRFDPAKGYGFIQVEGVPEDVFVYHSAIKMIGFRTLEPGDVVRFRLSRSQKGLRAEDVEKIGTTTTDRMTA